MDELSHEHEPAPVSPVEELMIEKFMEASQGSGSALNEITTDDGLVGLRVLLVEPAKIYMYLTAIKNDETGDEITEVITDPSSAQRHFRWVNNQLFEVFGFSGSRFPDRQPQKKDHLFEKMLISRIKAASVHNSGA